MTQYNTEVRNIIQKTTEQNRNSCFHIDFKGLKCWASLQFYGSDAKAIICDQHLTGQQSGLKIFTGKNQENFDAYDENGDGNLTVEEYFNH